MDDCDIMFDFEAVKNSFKKEIKNEWETVEDFNFGRKSVIHNSDYRFELTPLAKLQDCISKI